MGPIVPGDDENAGRVAIETVHDPGSLHAADRREPAPVVQQCVHERASAHARSWMDRHPRRLVDHQEVAVLVQDVQRDRLRLDSRRDGGGHVDADALAAADAVRGARRLPVHLHVAFADEPLQRSAAVAGDEVRQRLVETLATPRLG